MGWAGGEEGDGGNRAFVRGDGERTGVIPRRGGAWGNSLLGRKRMYSRWGRRSCERLMGGRGPSPMGAGPSPMGAGTSQ